MASEASGASGSTMGAIGSIYQGQAQASALDRAALIQRQNAALEIETGQANADRLMMSADKKIGAEQTGYAASGVSQDSGSVLSVIAASHANAELDKQNILHGAVVRATNYNNQATMDEVGAKSALQGSYMNALSSLMMGGSKIFGQSAGASTNYQPTHGNNSMSGGGDVEGGAVDDASMEAGDAAAADDAMFL